ncbi:SCP2 domain-containing protein [Pseudidiomarina sp.]|uniref:ubiquinone biosynthesis accessory factor UbiJ n=1 Tax=Pseudidiomarina sp. TaxID=2081707 RepID=UPI00299CE282|nr:SCP2 sterol-binding domain-containing protein [Pseudidiomarina sp.]MDX1705403.1 SCP2 sterol-binding domain-containing protein [Pseudidiomarina sp.]
MLWTVLPTGAMEALLNQLLGLDAGSRARLQKLQGKRLRVTLGELGKPLTLTATDQQLLLSWIDQEPVDCHIITRLAVLPELRDTANITRLIKADALDIEGDPLLAQGFSKLIADLDIDWPEQLSQRIGDVPAQFVVLAWQRSQRWLHQRRADQEQWVRDVLIEEQRLAPGKQEFAGFSEEVQALRARIDRIEFELKERQRGQ